ncbi:MAG: hypothetical protein ABFS05_03935 [Bacteroidota bacterium]
MKTLIKCLTLFVIGLFIFGNQVFAQILIAPVSGDPHPSAALEIRSETGGLLIPNIELTKVGTEAVATNISAPADGLLIFHDGQLTAGGSSGLPKGLWYFDATAGVSGKWLIYSRVGSIYSSSLDNFGEMYEINDMGSGTSVALNNLYSVPWANASAGFLGPGFSITYDTIVQTEQTGTTAIADQLTISTVKAYYTADVSTTLITNTSGNIVSGQLFVNDVPETAIFFRHAFQTSGEYVNCSTSGIIVLESGDKVDFRFKTTTSAEIIYVEHLNLKLTKIGDF